MTELRILAATSRASSRGRDRTPRPGAAGSSGPSESLASRRPTSFELLGRRLLSLAGARAMRALVLVVSLVWWLAWTTGCSSVHAAGYRIDGVRPRRHLGPVALYTLVIPPTARVVGELSVRATGPEANVEVLMPALMERAAELGATAATIDHVDTFYEQRVGYRLESRSVPCGAGAVCVLAQSVPYEYVVRTLEIRGRALLPQDFVEDPHGAVAPIP